MYERLSCNGALGVGVCQKLCGKADFANGYVGRVLGGSSSHKVQ